MTLEAVARTKSKSAPPIRDSTYTHNWGGLAIARDSIDEERHALAARILSLNTLRNQNAPISTLPPEMQASILIESIRGNVPFGPELSWSDRTALTLVCTHWRTVAVETPAFWARGIPLTPRKELSTMLARLKCAPFAVKMLDGEGIPSVEMLATLLTPQRLQRLRFTLGRDWRMPPALTHQCIDLFPKEAPFLTSLSMFKQRTPSHRTQIMDPGRIYIFRRP